MLDECFDIPEILATDFPGPERQLPHTHE